MLENKIYDTGMIVGRFQTFHKGHQRLVETALNLCDRVLILVGSSQECGTERNPLSVATRIDMIRAVYPDKDRVIIYPLPDLTHENDITADWGRFVLANADRYIYKAPELMIYGNDEARSHWFDTEDIKDTSEFIINRGALPISATMLRELMVADDRKRWMKHVDAKLHKFYDKLRAELMTVPFYQNLHRDLLLREQNENFVSENSNNLDTNACHDGNVSNESTNSLEAEQLRALKELSGIESQNIEIDDSLFNTIRAKNANMRVLKIFAGMSLEYDVILTDAPDSIIEQQLTIDSTREDIGITIEDPYDYISKNGYAVVYIGTRDDEFDISFDAEFDWYDYDADEESLNLLNDIQ